MPPSFASSSSSSIADAGAQMSGDAAPGTDNEMLRGFAGSSHRNDVVERGCARSSPSCLRGAPVCRNVTTTFDAFSTRTGASARHSASDSSETSTTNPPRADDALDTATQNTRVVFAFAIAFVRWKRAADDDARTPSSSSSSKLSSNPSFFAAPPPPPPPTSSRAGGARVSDRTLTYVTPTTSTTAGEDHDHTPPSFGRKHTARAPPLARHRVTGVSSPGRNDAQSSPPCSRKSKGTSCGSSPHSADARITTRGCTTIVPLPECGSRRETTYS